MKFLLDVCAASRRLRTQLADAGHDVVSAVEIDPLASDESWRWQQSRDAF